MSSRFVFRSEWRLPASRDDVYAALRDVGSYPAWWPQVRIARRLDEVSGELHCRSLLPYDLVFVVRREIEDPRRGILQVNQDGDLAGTSRWTISADGAATVAVFDEDVVVNRGSVRRAGLFARPLLRFNHELMMRDGERGLRRYLGDDQ